MQAFLDAVRKAALPAVWSQGVKLAREKSVSRGTGGGSGEHVMRVRAPGHAVAPTVSLYVDDDEWSCDCDAKTDPCAHVVAAAIALGNDDAPAAAAEATAPVAPTRLAYRLIARDRRLELTRVAVGADGKEEVVTSLVSRVARGTTSFEPTHEDILVDRIVSSSSKRWLPSERVADILGALSTSADVTLDGKPVRTSKEFVKPHAIVTDAPGGGFQLRVERDPAVTAVVAFGVALCGDVLRPLGETATTGEYLEKLPLVRTFAAKEQAELVTRVLPDIERTIELDVRTKKLARTTREARPRLHFDLSHQGHALSIFPTLVYGDPPIARVVGDEVLPIGAGRKAVVPVRRIDDEKALVLRLRDELNLVPGRRVDFDGQEAIRAAAKLRAFQARTTGREITELTGRPLVPRLVVDGDAFDVVFEQESDGDAPPRRAEGAAVLRAWRDGLDLVPVEGGGWAPLPIDWLTQHGHRVADLFAARAENESLPRAVLPDLGALCEALGQAPPMALGKLAPLLEGFEHVPHAELPADLVADLRPYQRSGIDWLSFLRDAELGGILADDMGLGKTLQTIAALRGRALVVCPRSVVYNWQAEIARFRPELKVAVYHGQGRAFDASANVTLTTYAVLRLDLEALGAEKWDAIVLDEAQAIKNPTSQTAQAAFALQAPFRVALSGTPVENRLEELWSIMRFANPGLLGGLGDFESRVSSPIANGDAAAATRLRAKIKPFLLRRMKREVLPELPPRTDAVLAVALEDSERAVYDAVRAATKKDVADKLAQGGGVLAALEALLRLRQAACHPALVPGQTAVTSSKMKRLVHALGDAAADGHKALVFSQWTSLLDLVEPHLNEAGIRFTRLDGTTRDRAAVVAELSREDGPTVMLISLKAGGTGLNLVAADHVFLLDPWWNPAVEDQAADRAHRIGQDRPVMVYRMVAQDTVEERILALQEKKRVIADVATGDASHAGGITRDDLLALLA